MEQLYFSLLVCAIGTIIITFGRQILDENNTETHTSIQKGTKQYMPYTYRMAIFCWSPYVDVIKARQSLLQWLYEKCILNRQNGRSYLRFITFLRHLRSLLPIWLLLIHSVCITNVFHIINVVHIDIKTKYIAPYILYIQGTMVLYPYEGFL